MPVPLFVQSGEKRKSQVAILEGCRLPFPCRSTITFFAFLATTPSFEQSGSLVKASLVVKISMIQSIWCHRFYKTAEEGIRIHHSSPPFISDLVFFLITILEYKDPPHGADTARASAPCHSYSLESHPDTSPRQDCIKCVLFRRRELSMSILVSVVRR